MLTPRENFIECITGGNPDRFVNQFDYMNMVGPNPYMIANANPKYGEHNVVNAWGVTKSFPIGTPGPFPVHTPDKIVIKDMEDWKEYVKAPSLEYPEEAWQMAIAAAEKVDKKQQFVTQFIAPGLFEHCHYLMEIQNCLINFYEYPDEMKDLIKYITDWEIHYGELFTKYLGIECVFHHDDWGSQISTFISPEMFEEFFLDQYKLLYGSFKENGVKYIVHHSDSYAATLIPAMIEMGIDVWQGVMKSNDISACLKQYGGQISFMGGVDSAEVDFDGWTPEIVAQKVRECCENFGNGGKYFIPCGSQGGAMSTYPGVYEAISAEIDKMSKEMFK